MNETLERKPVAFEVTNAGGAIPNAAWEEATSDSVKAVWLDMRTKHDEVVAISMNENCVPSIYVQPTSGSITEITFPELGGWDIWCAHCSRYTLRICFVKSQATP